MTTHFFNTAAFPAQPYIFDFAREVSAFYRDHPDQKRKIYFIDAATMPGSVCRGDETDEDEVEVLLRSNAGVFESNKQAYEGSSRSDFYLHQGYGTICLNLTRNSQRNLLGYEAGTDVSDVFVFDHEIGHLLCKNGLAKTNLRECVADAYATIRHIQRFGQDSAAIRRLVDKRAVELVFGDGVEHFTAPVVEKILADSAKMDFSKLTPTETVALAERYAIENPVDPDMTRRIAQDFKTLESGFPRLLKGDFTVIRLLDELVRNSNDPHFFKWGAVAVRALLEGDVNVNGERPPRPQGPEWTELRARLDDRASRFEPKPQKFIMVSDMGSLKL